jgi:succinate dehydrogenase / fumarate reductase flavoprotein subunit
MEVGPTCHYAMGGIRVDADTEATTVPGLFAAGECSGGMHGANRLGGNSLSDLLVFGRRAGIAASDFAEGRTGTPTVADGDIDAVFAQATAPLERSDGESPYDIQHALQETMQKLVGIIRTESELTTAMGELDKLEERCAAVSVSGPRTYNPGWNLATDLPAMLTVSRLTTKGAIVRRESRGGHTRDDYPKPDAELGTVNLVQRITPEGQYTLDPEALPQMPAELRTLFEEDAH